MITALIAFLLSFLAPPAMDADPVPAYEAEADVAAEGRDAPELPAQVWSAYETCAAVDALALEDGTLEWMRASGWMGQAGDGTEALYAPGCLQSA